MIASYRKLFAYWNANATPWRQIRTRSPLLIVTLITASQFHIPSRGIIFFAEIGTHYYWLTYPTYEELTVNSMAFYSRLTITQPGIRIRYLQVKEHDQSVTEITTSSAAYCNHLLPKILLYNLIKKFPGSCGIIGFINFPNTGALILVFLGSPQMFINFLVWNTICLDINWRRQDTVTTSRRFTTSRVLTKSPSTVTMTYLQTVHN